MSTSCLIAKQVNEQDFLIIYCHSDGYLTHNGALLVDFYDTEEKVDELLKLGDLSQLKEKMYPNPLYPHTFEERQEGVCVAYGRDRGDEDADAKMISIDEFIGPENMIQYMYVFDLDQRWKYFEIHESFQGFKDVKEDLQKEYAIYGMERPKGYYGDLYDEMAEELKMKTGQIEEITQVKMPQMFM